MTLLLYLSFILLGGLIYLRLQREKLKTDQIKLTAIRQENYIATLKHREEVAYERYLKALAIEKNKRQAYREAELYVLSPRSAKCREKAILSSSQIYSPLTEDKIA